MINCNNCRPQWPRGLRRGSAAARLLRLWVRIPPGACLSVSCECCVLSGRGLRVGLITRPEESYRVWCVCDREAPYGDAVTRNRIEAPQKKTWNNCRLLVLRTIFNVYDHLFRGCITYKLKTVIKLTKKGHYIANPCLEITSCGRPLLARANIVTLFYLTTFAIHFLAAGLIIKPVRATKNVFVKNDACLRA
jgi:hypothetical protein